MIALDIEPRILAAFRENFKLPVIVCPVGTDVKKWIGKFDLNHNGEILLIPIIREGDVIACMDVGQGGDYLYDGKLWHSGRYGVFTNQWVFVTDYHGFPSGALFRRV